MSVCNTWQVFGFFSLFFFCSASDVCALHPSAFPTLYSPLNLPRQHHPHLLTTAQSLTLPSILLLDLYAVPNNGLHSLSTPVLTSTRDTQTSCTPTPPNNVHSITPNLPPGASSHCSRRNSPPPPSRTNPRRPYLHLCPTRLRQILPPHHRRRGADATSRTGCKKWRQY